MEFSPIYPQEFLINTVDGLLVYHAEPPEPEPEEEECKIIFSFEGNDMYADEAPLNYILNDDEYELGHGGDINFNTVRLVVMERMNFK